MISIPSPPARLEPEPVIIEAMLRQCVDQGDVQSAVSMALVLGKRIRSRLPVEDRIMWINSYLGIVMLVSSLGDLVSNNERLLTHVVCPFEFYKYRTSKLI